jgi:hypothetical protein
VVGGVDDGWAKEMLNVGEGLSKPSAGSAGVESVLLVLLDASRRRSAIVAADLMCRAV